MAELPFIFGVLGDSQFDELTLGRDSGGPSLDFRLEFNLVSHGQVGFFSDLKDYYALPLGLQRGVITVASVRGFNTDFTFSIVDAAGNVIRHGTPSEGGARHVGFESLPAGQLYIEISAGTNVLAAPYVATLRDFAGAFPRTEVYLTAGPDNFVATVAAEYIHTGDGYDTVFAGAGDDVLDGLGGPNYLRGEDGNDTLAGGNEFDDLHGNMGDDSLNGWGGDDWVVGGKGADLLLGRTGADIVYGNIGNDGCNGGEGNDTVRGGQDDDVVRGEAGDDWLSGDRGADTVAGGTGADIFHTFGEAGLDRVTDFNAGEGDRVMLDPGTQYTVAQAGADTVISMVGGGEMVLVGVQLATLQSGWIFGA